MRHIVGLLFALLAAPAAATPSTPDDIGRKLIDGTELLPTKAEVAPQLYPGELARLAEELRAETARGITVFFPRQGDGGTYATLSGSSVVFRFIGGDHRGAGSDRGSFSFKRGRLTLHGSASEIDIVLIVRQPDEQLKKEGARFLLVAERGFIVGVGPAELPAEPALKAGR